MSDNSAGQADALTVLTPILPAEEPALRSYLEGLSQAESPLARVGRVHFGRWVIVTDFHSETAQPKRDELGSPYLLFSTCSDGPLDSYLDELCERLAPEAGEIWGRCVGCPNPAGGEALKRYLLHNRIDTGFFASAYPHATVEDVRRCLDQRDRMIDLAVRTQGMDAAELRRTVLAEIGR